jgi:hypothetical protein
LSAPALVHRAISGARSVEERVHQTAAIVVQGRAWIDPMTATIWLTVSRWVQVPEKYHTSGVSYSLYPRMNHVASNSTAITVLRSIVPGAKTALWESRSWVTMGAQPHV